MSFAVAAQVLLQRLVLREAAKECVEC